MDLPTMGRSSALREHRNGVRGTDCVLNGFRMGFTAASRAMVGPSSIVRKLGLQCCSASSIPFTPTCLPLAIARTESRRVDQQPSVAVYGLAVQPGNRTSLTWIKRKRAGVTEA